MPVLAAEPAIFPESLLGELPSNAEEQRWWVLHTRPRQEKSLARQLHGSGVPFYLPLIARRSLVRGRIVTSQIPLFASYVFLWAEERERVRALATQRVVRAIGVPDQDQLWHDLRQVQQLIATGSPITPEDRLVPGSAVEIRQGPLAGLRGVILRHGKGRRFIVQVNFIQRGASVEVDDFLLGPVDD
jgi:transcriptional antiterminator RfaH